MATVRIFKHHLRLSILLLAATEAVVLAAAVYLAAHLRYLSAHGPDGAPLVPMGLRAATFATVTLLALAATGLYQAQMRDRLPGVLQRLAVAALLSVTALALLYYLVPPLFVDRSPLALAVLLGFSGVLVVRLLFYRYFQDMFQRRVLVLGSGRNASSIAALRRRSDRRGFRILGFVHVRGDEDQIDADRVLHLERPLVDYAEDRGVDEIVLAVDDRRKDFLPHELLRCRMAGIQVTELIGFFERETGKIRLDFLNPSWLIFSDGFQRSALRDGTKRLLDVVVSLTLFAAVWPVMALTALAILLESGPGAPILYRQVRVGQNGRPFRILKFRSMKTDAEQAGRPQWAARNDDRITRVGRFIRRTRIDELPQLWNVLRGDMSFVGPRPERPEFTVSLADSLPYYSERHLVKPGITGWAQLNYPYGASIEDAREKLQYDLYYVKNHTTFLDLAILLQTVAVVLFGKGAR